MAATAAIFGCEGRALSRDEARFFKDADPWGFILFARNLETPEQIKSLTSELRSAVGRQAPILIDQEGGRVQRLRAPQWRDWLAPLDQMDRVSSDNQREAMALRYRLIADELHDLGIDVNCAPMLDLACKDSHEIITNRCYGSDVDTVSEMGRAVSEGLLAGGVLPIIKHIPGHGRGSVDSHFGLPVVDTAAETLSETDFVPFGRLSDLPMAMTAHIVYSAIDAELCATLSPKVIDVIRNQIGFRGLLMTDDLSMKALDGSFESRTARALQAGCDIILHCNGDRSEMTQIMNACPRLSGVGLDRADAALAMRRETPMPLDIKATEERLAALLGA